MKVDTMRRIDYLAGIPLCWLATWLVRLLDLFSARGADRPIRRALFVELSEMGSAVLVDPAMRKLARETGAELYFVIFKKNAPSLRLLGTVPEANVYTIREDSLWHLAWDTLRFFWWTRRTGIDTVYDLELFSRYSALLTGLSGARRRIGFHAYHNEGLYRGAMLTHRVWYNPHLHISRVFVALVNAGLAEKPELPYSKTLVTDDEVQLARAAVEPAQQEAVRERIRALYPEYDPAAHRLVLINPNASDLLPQRRWMPDRYVALMQRILEQYDDTLVLITGAPAEQAQAESLREQVGHPRCVNFAGQVGFLELVPLYSIAALMVSNDSGPGHFAAVTDLPTFVIFGPETPALYGPLGNTTPIYAGLACSPCVSAANHRKTACTDNVCLKVIDVGRVFDTIRPVLSKGAAD
ncbi:MAG: glycosyltransferase family 9 protein [Gammaproteobacteria bacterium]